MEEFNGPKALIDENGVSYPTQQYMKWLEDRVAELTRQLVASKHSYHLPRRLNDDNDYIPYPDEGDDR